MGGKVKRHIIITAYCNNKLRKCISFREDDVIICADGGYWLAKEEGITPNIVIGDFDSNELPSMPDCKIIELPSIKDDTDTLSCLRYALSLGDAPIVIVGGIGGRLDHTIANLQLLAFALNVGRECVLTDGDNTAQIIKGGEELIIQKRNGFTLSLFAYTPTCEGVSIKGVKYPLDKATLRNSFPLGVSNEIISDVAELSVDKGKLLVVSSKMN